MVNLPLAAVLHRLRSVLRGWANYFRHGVSSRTFSYLDAHTWRRVAIWLRNKHRRAAWKYLHRRYRLFRGGPVDDGVTLFRTASVGLSATDSGALGYLRRPPTTGKTSPVSRHRQD